MKNKYNYTIIIGTLISVLGILILLIKDELAYSLGLKNPISISLISSISFLYGVGVLLFAYLQYNRRIVYDQSDNLLSNNNIREELELLKLDLYKLSKQKKNSVVDNLDDIDIDKVIKNLINQNLESEKFIKLVEDKFKTQIEDEAKITRVNRDFENINQRIGFEIARLSKSANINLVFGSVTTLMAIGFLGYEILKKPLDFTELIPLLSHYIPRIAIVIFVEVFAFFFLKIYKTNLNDIKYFHNEKTNIDLKLIAMKSAISTKNDEINRLVIEELSKTERNFVLKKDETTIEIEKEKIDANNSQSVINALKDIIKTK